MKQQWLRRRVPWLCLLPLLLGLVAPAAALEEPHRLGSPEQLIARFRALSEELGISPDQVDKAIRIGLEIYRQNTLVEAHLRVARMELALLLEAEPLNTSAIRTKVNEIADLEKERLTTEMEGQIRYREILSLEQYRRFKDALYSGMMGQGRRGRYDGRE